MPFKRRATRSIACCFVVLAAVSSLDAAETMAGPTQTLCAEVFASPYDKLTAVQAWVVGYVSGVNEVSKADFLKGINGESIIATEFRGICAAQPEMTVLEAARNVVFRFRMQNRSPNQGSN